MKNSLFTFSFAFFTLLLAGCSSGDDYVTFSGFAQGTTYTITANSHDRRLGGQIDRIFAEMDGTFSMFNPESLVSRINRGETDVTTPLFDECFAIAQVVHERTGGYYDITVKPLVDAWGFGPGEKEDAPCVERLMEYVGMDKVYVEDGRITKSDPRVQLDFSSVAKGLTVDRLAGMLDAAGARDYMIYVGGEVRVRGVNAAGNPWRIGIDKPLEGFDSKVQVVVVFSGGNGELSGENIASIATSGNYHNWFVDENGYRRVHTIDAKSGEPAVGNILSVSIVAPECGIADAWATGLMASHDIDNVRVILPKGGIEYYIIYTDDGGSVATLRSDGFPLEKK